MFCVEHQMIFETPNAYVDIRGNNQTHNKYIRIN